MVSNLAWIDVHSYIFFFVSLDDAHAARRKYKKDLDFIKPDLEAYNKQKALTMSQGSGALSTFNSAGIADHTVASEEQRLAAENLYRDANTLIYGDNKPSEDAIDRVVSKINREYVVPHDALISIDLSP
jgi:pre-mRNA-splicing factor SYF2